MSSLHERLAGSVIPAVPVPFDNTKRIDQRLHRSYIQWMDSQPVGGVAVWAHTGRGLKLSDDQRDTVLSEWRSGLTDKVIVCGVGIPDTSNLPKDPESRTDACKRIAVTMAQRAADGGTDALLVYPPVCLARLPNADDRVLDYHKALCSVGLPVIAFYLYEAGGGIGYSPRLMERILELDGAVGVKIATLDSIMTYQDIVACVRRVPDAMVITGEDRFLGYSFVAGAQAALIGMGAVVTDRCCALADAWSNRDLESFYKLTVELDTFSRATFVDPMEGYVQRVLWALQADGIFSSEAIDPWAPALQPEERDRVFAAVRLLRSQ